jgi:hypothetical protein
MWTSWNVTFASASITRITAVFGTIASTLNGSWLTETATAAFKVFTGNWWTFFFVADTDEFWAQATVFVFSIDSNSFFVRFATWSFDLEAGINTFVFNAFVSEATFIASVSQKSFVGGASWNIHAQSRSVVTTDQTVFETRASVASISKVVPLFTQSSGASGFVNTLWWWSWSWANWWGGGWFTYAIFDHLFTSWTTAFVFTSPFSPGNWFAIFSARTFVGTSFWGVTLALFGVTWFAVSEVVSDDGVDFHSWAIASDVFLWWTRFWLARSFVTASDGVIRIDSDVTGFTWFKFFDGFSTFFISVRSGVLVEFVFTLNQSTNKPRFLTDSGIIDFVDDSSQWNNNSVVIATEFWWFTRFQDFATAAKIKFVGWSVVFWARLNFAFGFWDTFADIFEAWTFVVGISVVGESLFFNLSGTSITSDFFLGWARNIITTVLAGSSVATSIKAIFVAQTNSTAILEILANSWNMFDSWSFTVNQNTSVFITSIFRSPFVTDGVFFTFVFTEVFFASFVADTRGVRFTFVFGFFGWSTGQVMATWSTNWSFFDAIIAEVTHDDFTFTSTFGGHTFDIIVEDHFSGFHESTVIVTSSGGIAFFQAWEIKAFGRVSGATFTSFSSDFVGLTWWAYWWMINAETFVALAFKSGTATFTIIMVANIIDLNEFLSFSSTSWNSEFSAFSFKIWNEFGTRWSFWAIISSAASIFRNMSNKGFTEFTNWFFFVSTGVFDVVASNFSGFGTATWLTDIVFVVEEIAFVVFNTFMFASVTTGARVRNTSAFVNGFTQFTAFSLTKWSNGGWASVTDTFVFQTAVKSFSFISNRV